MRETIAVLVLLLAASLFPAPIEAQNLDTVQIRTQQVAEGIHMLIGSGGNIGVSVGPDAVFVIDDQFAPLTPKILAAIQTLTDRPVRFVLNTHWHGDHTGGNENMGKAGALLVAHDNVRQRMSTRQFMELMQRDVPPSPPGALPVVTFSEGVTFHVNGDEVSATHAPAAHTDGDAVVRFRRANVVHMGDVFNATGFPFVDRSSGGTLDGVIAGIEGVLAWADGGTRVIPGHGGLSDRRGLEEYRSMLVTVRDRVRQQVAAGASLERILASKPTAEFDQRWGGGMIKPDDLVRFAHADAARR